MINETKAEILANILLKLNEICETNKQIIDNAIESNSLAKDISTFEKIDNISKLLKLTDFQIELLIKIRSEILDKFKKN